jgi:hypothetical protein
MNRIIAATLAMSMLAAAAAAQAQEHAWDSLKGLRAGERIQVVDQKLKSQDGSFASLSNESITFQVGKDAVVIQRADVLRISSRERSHRLRNTFIGLGIGIGAGAAAAGAMVASGGEIAITGGAAAGGVLAAGGIGAGIGAAIPAGRPTIYRAEQRRIQSAP